MGQRQGIVVSNIGTGVLYTHKPLKGDWGSDYGWYDPNGKKTAPYDGCPGTHTMGAFAAPNASGLLAVAVRQTVAQKPC
ncbi:unnamed protein product [Aphanomyces euteiches]